MTLKNHGDELLKFNFIILVVIVICACSYNYDSIDEAHINTRRVLQSYSKNNDESKVYTWLFSQHGEAPGHQVFITLASWSFRNPDHFMNLVNNLPQGQIESFIGRYAFAVTDSGQSEGYKKAFAKKSDDTFKKIELEISNNIRHIENFYKKKKEA